MYWSIRNWTKVGRTPSSARDPWSRSYIHCNIINQSQCMVGDECLPG
jgi:hypothetical protein